MKTVLKLFWADLKILVRNKQALFWSLAFPLMFTFIFGFFFGNENKSLGSIAYLNNSDTELASGFTEAINESELFDLTTGITEEEAKDKLDTGGVSAIIIVPSNFGNFNTVEKGNPAASVLPPQIASTLPKLEVPEFEKSKIKVIYDANNMQASSVILTFVDKFLSEANLKVQGGESTYSIEEVRNSKNDASYFDFVLAGLIGLALMNSSIMGIAIGMSKYREDKILKRITTTPLKTWKFITAEVAARLTVNVVQISLILLVGVGFFHANIFGSYVTLFAISLLGGLLFQLIGFTIASVTKTADAAQGLSQVVTIPMMFLAGVFFPTDQLPKWLNSIVEFLPLAPLLRMIRDVALDGKSVFSDPKNMIIVGSWIIICFLISVFRFKLSEE